MLKSSPRARVSLKLAKSDADNTLNIKIRATDGSEVFFKIKKTTKLNKLKVGSGGTLLIQDCICRPCGTGPFCHPVSWIGCSS